MFEASFWKLLGVKKFFKKIEINAKKDSAISRLLCYKSKKNSFFSLDRHDYGKKIQKLAMAISVENNSSLNFSYSILQNCTVPKKAPL